MKVATAAEAKVLIEAELARCSPDVRRWLERRRYEPLAHGLVWDHDSPEPSFAWRFASLGGRNVHAAYWPEGYGELGSPWGLVFADSDYFGQDTGWYRSLEELLSEWLDGSDA